MKKVVVLGGSGFLGSHVADELTACGYDVTVFDRVCSPYLQAGQRMVQGDLLDRKALEKSLEGVRYVFHFAGVSDIGESTRKPTETMEVNVMGTCAVLEACLRARVSRLVFASSMYVYCDRGSFYRVSKQACEKLIEEYGNEFSLSYTILRIGTPYGPRANHFNAIQRMLTQALFEKRIILSGSPDDVRDYIHVSDTAREAVAILSSEYANRHVIVTGHQRVPLSTVTTLIRDILSGEVDVEFKKRDSCHHYKTTPYAFKPSCAVKRVPEHYQDLGQGLLELLYEFGSEGRPSSPT
ncbi:MAG: NAD(P)-dependent oxidoreductase [Desulfobacterales bacterium]|nr:NAD(P)-dependent oxidoreductase [Desulfobacterales bacterium]